MPRNCLLLPFLASLTAFGCAAEDASTAPGDGAGGKADEFETDGTAELDCAPDQELSLELSGVESTNTIRATCHNGAGFEDDACCEAAGLHDAFQAATSCPLSAEIDGARCRDSEGGQFVASACCADLCQPVERNSAGQCIAAGSGQFDEEMCCFLQDALAANSCDGAAWTTVTVAGESRDACRNAQTGQFAMNSCCAAECVQAISDEELSLTSIPEPCAAQVELEAPEAECPDGSRENAAGICHNPGNGQFVKAACCEARGLVAVMCGFDKAPSFGVFGGGQTPDGGTIDPSHQLADAAGEPAPLSREEIEANPLLADQVKAAILHDGFLLPAGRRNLDEFSLDEVLDNIDFGEVFFVSAEVGGVELDWVQFFAGDTEVGAVFNAGTLEIIAEIGDGDISGCSPE
jgi:hypothetical protein